MLLTGVGVVLWAEQRLVYRPMQLLQRALVGFQLGSSWTPAPELGARELRNIARAFNDMVARLERQREAQVSFLAGVAHDLRNPITALKLAASGAGSGTIPPERALNNLLSNAIKYSPEGGPVRIRVVPEQGGHRIEVTDSGVGIAPSEKESIFEPFRRSASTRETIPGVGLGLAVARKILVAHGGSLDVESEPGKGSTFSVRLPARPLP
ncbi:MAG TPA: sensor histidine kinase [Archangium sp.]|uniref:HAMP domain-containing sensor histidine kinase n=1 Tax=Archangium sp. TaxID=1872627 RepID=UPI002E338482|nr:sensor histidine kinase [Archangium sp.]HEX5753892.1 sensor histidine kinase [Archangium sp.]